ncbi:hypothetical protein Q5424_09190 [Conexibacter sp. JD483]|uniref:hypothetical protein n=1 Tax=unclassified Conexibacter TaxID=2627773 RepID=UPI00271D8F63|nr:MULTISPECIES: hypothetical protein [unclassified Conexibacter]MDO8184541.1 hypothetical protein [Conexibacter sp. CPCC 205706]MDO8197847.1 hypothetical protein [Conexibacter sp. CPCC 205762]MDR9369253.1 hypothetical protein [Conexibacter sp. JD483]
MADLFGRGRRRRRKAQVSSWHQAGAAVPLENLAAANELAQEAASPFGYKRSAGDLLARFGGDTPDGRRRATAALALAGVLVDPPLTEATANQLVRLRHSEVDPAAMQPLAEPLTPPAQTPTPTPPAPDAPADVMPRRPSWAMRVASRHATSGPVDSESRFRAGALGLLALVVLIVAVVLLRGAIGSPGGGDRGGDLAPPATATTTTTTTAQTPPATTPAPEQRRDTLRYETRPSRRARLRRVRLRIVPREPSYLCVADGAGRTLWEGMRTGPYEVSRRRLRLRVGVATMRISVDGRPLTVRSAPSAYLLTPRGVSGLPADRPVCGAG